MRYLFVILLLFVCCSSPKNEAVKDSYKNLSASSYEDEIQLLQDYSRDHNYSENYAILVDFARPSFIHRMFVVSLTDEVIIGNLSGLVVQVLVCLSSKTGLIVIGGITLNIGLKV